MDGKQIEQLAAYAEEMGHEYITLEQLINSHRILRSFRLEFNGKLAEERQRAYTGVIEDYKQRKVIPIETLSAMTLHEILDMMVGGVWTP